MPRKFIALERSATRSPNRTFVAARPNRTTSNPSFFLRFFSIDSARKVASLLSLSIAKLFAEDTKKTLFFLPRETNSADEKTGRSRSKRPEASNWRQPVTYVQIELQSASRKWAVLRAARGEIYGPGYAGHFFARLQAERSSRFTVKWRRRAPKDHRVDRLVANWSNGAANFKNKPRRNRSLWKSSRLTSWLWQTLNRNFPSACISHRNNRNSELHYVKPILFIYSCSVLNCRSFIS